MTDELDTNQGVTRREALKKGARLGGALVWAVPVVQTVGMSPALAQTASEGNCCLRILRLTATEFGNGDDVRVSGRLRNCGTSLITDVFADLERRVNDGPWTDLATLTIADLNAGSSGGFDLELVNRTAPGEPGPGEYQYRVKGRFTCLGVEFPQHTIPGSEWVESNKVTVVTP